MFSRQKSRMLSPAEALPGRDVALPVPETHAVHGRQIVPPFPDGMRTAVFGMGCFWGAERLFWQTPGVYSTAVGYAGGYTKNPTYEEVCSGLTGHAEVVRVIYDPAAVSYEDLLAVFWENHDPTQGMAQGGDVGTQYRSVILTLDQDQAEAAERSREAYQQRLTDAGHGAITSEVVPAGAFFYAEEYHQQYLSEAKNPGGYCGLAGTGVNLGDPSAAQGACPTGLRVPDTG